MQERFIRQSLMRTVRGIARFQHEKGLFLAARAHSLTHHGRAEHQRLPGLGHRHHHAGCGSHDHGLTHEVG